MTMMLIMSRAIFPENNREMGPRALLAAALLDVLFCTVTASYACPASTCRPPTCICASMEAPLAPASTVPQFIVLTNDDAATLITVPAVLGVLDRYKNRNGCPLPATWFVSVQYTQPEWIQKLYLGTHEIATHTMNHVALPNATEIVGARRWLNEVALVPLDKIRGFRGPYLLHDEQQRSVLAANGFAYDSTITSTWGPQSFFPDAAHSAWPFTMDYDCTVGTGACSLTESHPGLWEFPIWDVEDDEGMSVASMDPVGNATELYIRELLRRYHGNRAPVGLFLHAAVLLTPAVADQYAAFFQYALALPDTWVVTISEVLRWMEAPLPISQYNLSCPTPTDMVLPNGGQFCPPPNGGCVQGNWSRAACTCLCINEGVPDKNGFCKDPVTGACTVVKSYSLATRAWTCPLSSAERDVASPLPASSPTATGTNPATSSPASTGTNPATSSPAATGTSSGSSLPATDGSNASPPGSGAVSDAPGLLGGVPFSFNVQGQVSSLASSATEVCGAVALLAGEAPNTCSIASVTEAAAPTTSSSATRRLASTGYLHVIVVIRPASHTEQQVADALAAAKENGRLAYVLQAVGVQLALEGQAISAGNLIQVDVLSAAPSNNRATVGAAVGGAVGGAAVVCMAAAAFLLVRSRRARSLPAGGHHAAKSYLPTSTMSAQEEVPSKHKLSPPAKGLSLTAKAGPMKPGEQPVTAYSSTPRSSTATPRHGAQQLSSFGSTFLPDAATV